MLLFVLDKGLQSYKAQNPLQREVFTILVSTASKPSEIPTHSHPLLSHR